MRRISESTLVSDVTGHAGVTGRWLENEENRKIGRIQLVKKYPIYSIHNQITTLRYVINIECHKGTVHAQLT